MAMAATESSPLLGGGAPQPMPTTTTTTTDEPEEIENPNRPTGFKFAIVFSCILLGDIFVGYDTSCVTTLAPVITDEFNAIDDLAWYGIAYVLAMASTLLAFGQLYTIYPMKMIICICFGIFGIGSAISAAAPSSLVFILGRAISGVGGSGIFAGGSIIVANTTPLKSRAIYQAIAGGIESVALSIGPLVAGALAQASGWRTAFWITVPASLCIIAAISLLIDGLPQPERAGMKTEERYQQLDLVGFVLFVPATVTLILALQWGGTMYAWDSARVIALLVLAAILAVAFAIAEKRKGDNAMFPLHFLRQRSVLLGSLSQFCMSASLFVFCFYLPIYFQAVRNASPLASGFMYLPTAVSLAIGVLVAGNLTSWLGYYTIVMVVGSTLLAVGAGLMTTFKLTTAPAHWITYQVLFGLGAGLAFQQTYTAVQTVLPEKHVATALVILSFMQELGGIVALAISQNVFLNGLVSRLDGLVPELDPRDILDSGTLDLPSLVAEKYRDVVRLALNKTVMSVFIVGVVAACGTICSIGIEWRSVKHEKKEESQAETNS